MTRKSCLGCIYLQPITSMYPNEKNCHYLLMTGQPRNCDATNCDKKVVAKPNCIVEIISKTA